MNGQSAVRIRSGLFVSFRAIQRFHTLPLRQLAEPPDRTVGRSWAHGDKASENGPPTDGQSPLSDTLSSELVAKERAEGGPERVPYGAKSRPT